MSEQATIYVPRSSAKRIKFQSGKEILKVSFHAEELIAFVKQHANAKGYINFTLVERRELGKFGDTHAVVLDTWEPGQKRAGSDAPAPRQQAAPAPTRQATPVPPEDDVPF